MRLFDSRTAEADASCMVMTIGSSDEPEAASQSVGGVEGGGDDFGGGEKKEDVAVRSLHYELSTN
jgi:hypothetical protein